MNSAMVNEGAAMEAPKVRCRAIAESDIAAVADLLTRGFAGRPWAYWQRGLRRQAEREAPDGYPRYGYLLESGDAIVGVLLLLYSARGEGERTVIRCNVSSWYVEPAFRVHATLLTGMAQKHRHVTYLNVTPAPATWPIIEAQGFKRYCSGLFFSLPALSRPDEGATVEVMGPDAPRPAGLPEAEFQRLSTHARYGCLSLVCRTPGDTPHPFILTPFRIQRGRVPLPALQLVYCRDVADYVRHAGTIGRFLLRYGKPVVILDANGPVPGLFGLFTQARGRKYFKGPHPPQLADLAETEIALFGP